MIARGRRAVWLGFVLLTLAGAPAGAQQLPGDTFSFPSHGSALRARYYRSTLPGPRPTVLLVHGFPGGPVDMLGLGVALSEAGWNALFYNPRGMHGSEGEYAPEGGIEDAAVALAYLRDGAARFAVDTAHMAVVGYSHGGWVALMTGIRGTPVRCIAAIAPDNLGLAARRIDSDSVYAAGLRQALQGAAQRGFVRGLGFEAASAQLRAHRDEYDPTLHAAALAGRAVLIVGGWRDNGPTIELYIAPLVRALRAGGARVTPVALDDDHAFRTARQELHRSLLDWLGRECARAQPTTGTAPG